MKRLILLILVVVVGTGVFIFVKRSTPFSDRTDFMSADISIDSIWSIGPAAVVYEMESKKYYWLKSYTSFDQSDLDTLKSKHVRIRYLKFLMGPLENRIIRIEVDSVVVFDQVIERN